VPVSDDYLDYVLDLYSTWGGVSVRKMFGGAGLYREGRMFALIADDTVYLKVDDSNRPVYEERGCLPLQDNDNDRWQARGVRDGDPLYRT